jgi:hypothetical protein
MGHLTRQRDPEDERQVRVRLTPPGPKRARAGARVSRRACQGDGARCSGLPAPPRGAGEIARQPVGRGARETVAAARRCEPKHVRRIAMPAGKTQSDLVTMPCGARRRSNCNALDLIERDL